MSYTLNRIITGYIADDQPILLPCAWADKDDLGAVRPPIRLGLAVNDDLAFDAPKNGWVCCAEYRYFPYIQRGIISFGWVFRDVKTDQNRQLPGG